MADASSRTPTWPSRERNWTRRWWVNQDRFAVEGRGLGLHGTALHHTDTAPKDVDLFREEFGIEGYRNNPQCSWFQAEFCLESTEELPECKRTTKRTAHTLGKLLRVFADWECRHNAPDPCEKHQVLTRRVLLPYVRNSKRMPYHGALSVAVDQETDLLRTEGLSISARKWPISMRSGQSAWSPRVVVFHAISTRALQFCFNPKQSRQEPTNLCFPPCFFRVCSLCREQFWFRLHPSCLPRPHHSWSFVPICSHLKLQLPFRRAESGWSSFELQDVKQPGQGRITHGDGFAYLA